MSKRDIEVIDGVRGEWRTVTNASEVYVGQRVRYEYRTNNGIRKFGYNEEIRVLKIEAKVITACNGVATDYHLFDEDFWSNIQAFFPLPAKRKVEKVEIKWMAYEYPRVKFKWCVLHPRCSITSSIFYSSKRSAIRGARRFCKTIGYECEIEKGGE